MKQILRNFFQSPCNSGSYASLQLFLKEESTSSLRRRFGSLTRTSWNIPYNSIIIKHRGEICSSSYCVLFAALAGRNSRARRYGQLRPDQPNRLVVAVWSSPLSPAQIFKRSAFVHPGDYTANWFVSFSDFIFINILIKPLSPPPLFPTLSHVFMLDTKSIHWEKNVWHL